LEDDFLGAFLPAEDFADFFGAFFVVFFVPLDFLVLGLLAFFFTAILRTLPKKKSGRIGGIPPITRGIIS
jgi:hypothetical protein